MAAKTVPVLAYLLYTALSAVIYGLFAFFVIYRGLSGKVMLNAYLWNIAFIIVTLIADKVVNDILLAKETAITKSNYFIAIAVHVLSFISFKTTLYFFYAFVLIVSRISILEPALISDEFRNFVLAIEYCLILVVVFDKFIEHLLKDDKRVKKISAKFERFSTFINAKRNRKKEIEKRITT